MIDIIEFQEGMKRISNFYDEQFRRVTSKVYNSIDTFTNPRKKASLIHAVDGQNYPNPLIEEANNFQTFKNFQQKIQISTCTVALELPALSFFPRPASAPLSSLAASRPSTGFTGVRVGPASLGQKPMSRRVNRHAFQFLLVAPPRFVSLIRRYPTFEFFTHQPSFFPLSLQRDREQHPIQKFPVQQMQIRVVHEIDRKQCIRFEISRT